MQFKLHDGTEVPAIGFGTYGITANEDAIVQAIRNGYKLIDTAWIYENEELVGRAMKKAAAEGFPRDYLVATKVWPNHFTADLTKRSVDRSLRAFGTDTLDIVYTHWPAESLAEAWRVLERYKEQGIIRTIGVSNLNREQYERFKQTANIPPALNQIELHPLWPELELVAYLQEENVLPVGYSPLARMEEALMHAPVLQAICERCGRSPAQVLLRWQIERGILPIPKSERADRQQENIDVFNFELSPEDLAALSTLGRPDGKIGKQSTDIRWQKEMKETALS